MIAGRNIVKQKPAVLVCRSYKRRFGVKHDGYPGIPEALTNNNLLVRQCVPGRAERPLNSSPRLKLDVGIGGQSVQVAFCIALLMNCNNQPCILGGVKVKPAVGVGQAVNILFTEEQFAPAKDWPLQMPR